MQKTVTVYKPLGITPFQTVVRFKEKYPAYKNETVSYAGRLDPMAEGLLLLLIGDENKKRTEYQGLPKKYEFTVLLGVETDTYDILGKVIYPLPSTTYHRMVENRQWTIAKFKTLLPSLTGTRQQPYPPYSSKTVKGKPLYWWARQNKLHEITIPAKEVTITQLSLTSLEETMKSELQTMIFERINKVHGNFRQEEITKSWEKFFNNEGQMFLANCSIACSSGTYVRSVAHKLGQQLGVGAIALNIKRTQLGKFSLTTALEL